MARRLRRFSLTPIRFRKRHQLQLVMALMSLNILISLSILNQQSKLTTIFDTYISNFRYKHDNNKLLKLLDSYRSVFNSDYQQPNNKSNTVVVVDQSQAKKARPFNLRHRLAISITGIFSFCPLIDLIWLLNVLKNKRKSLGFGRNSTR